MNETLVMVTLTHIECGECGVAFGMTPHYIAERRRDHRTWYCPNGHPRHYPGKSDIEQLRDDLAREKHRAEQAQASANYQRGEAGRLGRRLTATRGVITRIKNRVGHGVCPCCNRTFQQLARHMASQHPTYAEVPRDA